MSGLMATNIPKNVLAKPWECTEFQLHKSQHTILNGILRKVYDFSEHKLIEYIKKIDDAQQRVVLNQLLKDYISGNVALAWRKGQPVWIKVTKV